MSASSESQIECDTPGCEAFMRAPLTPGKIRAQLRTEGWLCNSSGDWCEYHYPARMQ